MITFKNMELQPVSNFLQSLKLANKTSRARTRLVTKISEKLENLVSDQKELLEKYGQRDNEGNLIRDGNNAYLWNPDDSVEANKASIELNNEEVSIDLSEYKAAMKILTTALDSYSMELSEVDANIYNLLMDKLEEETK